MCQHELGSTKPTELIKQLQRIKTVGSAHPTEKQAKSLNQTWHPNWQPTLVTQLGTQTGHPNGNQTGHPTRQPKWDTKPVCECLLYQATSFLVKRQQRGTLAKPLTQSWHPNWQPTLVTQLGTQTGRPKGPQTGHPTRQPKWDTKPVW
jgi:hypothetical protein